MSIIKNAPLQVVLAVAVACGFAACDRNSSKPTTGVMSQDQGGVSGRVDQAEKSADDAAITAKIKVALLEAPDLKSMDISVETRNGQVTLSGTVPEAPQVDQAAKVAGGIEGVRNVDNKLSVRSAS